MKEQILPDGYRFLEHGEQVQEGDLIKRYMESHEWVEAKDRFDCTTGKGEVGIVLSPYIAFLAARKVGT